MKYNAGESGDASAKVLTLPRHLFLYTCCCIPALWKGCEKELLAGGFPQFSILAVREAGGKCKLKKSLV